MMNFHVLIVDIQHTPCYLRQAKDIVDQCVKDQEEKKYFHDNTSWSNLPNISKRHLIYKNIIVYQIHCRLGKGVTE